MNALIEQVQRWDERFRRVADWAGSFAPALFLRLILSYEFMDSGLEKLHGQNWFSDIQSQFPFPFNVLPVDISWFIATWAEILGAVLLVLGLGTRYVAVMLMVLTFVAAYAVHFPAGWGTLAEFWQGYAITDNGHGNYKLPLLFFLMFLVLVGKGAGRLSLDHWLARRNGIV